MKAGREGGQGIYIKKRSLVNFKIYYYFTVHVLLG